MKLARLQKQLLQRVSNGLKRAGYTSCSEWTKDHRVMGQPFPGPWSFKYHPWLLDMHNCQAPISVGQKAAQMGFTETMLNISLYEMDINGQSVLYLLPNKTPDATDFSSARFANALELSPYLRDFFSDTSNVGHKRAGSTNLYIRGARSRSALKSNPVAVIIFDEVDEMNPQLVRLGEERTSGQKEERIWKISTPSTHDDGINSAYKRSTQEHFFFPCPHCHRQIELKWPESFDLDAANIICYECKAVLDHDDKVNFLGLGKWIPANPNAEVRGFHVSQLYSCTMTPLRLAKKARAAQESEYEKTEFYNSNLGLPYESDGARVTEGQVTASISTTRSGELPKQDHLIAIGIDVGSKIHYEVDAFLPNNRLGDLTSRHDPLVIEAGSVTEFEQLDLIIQRFKPHCFVIDINPEQRKALELCHRYRGFGFACQYVEGITGKDLKRYDEECKIAVNRTVWMDAALGRFINCQIRLPMDISKEYQSHIVAPVRVYTRDDIGNHISRYKEGTRPDHHAHTRTYCEIALALYNSSTVSDIIEDI